VSIVALDNKACILVEKLKIMLHNVTVSGMEA
jgi:hypothetical protein